MLESTFIEQNRENLRWYVVYDTRNGNVVHTHQFISGAGTTLKTEPGNNETEIALKVAAKNYDATYLEVMEAPRDFNLEPGMMTRVDITTGELVVLNQTQFTFREFVKQARATKEKKSKGTL